MKVLLTGGAGYIGSHTAVALIEAGHDVVVVDSLANSSREAVRRVEKLTNATVSFYQRDIAEPDQLDDVFTDHSIDAVIHFAGLKAVGESVSTPLHYYQVNINSTLNLVTAMTRHGVSRLVFSSSATVYGEPDEVPMSENTPVIDATNPYGRSKLMQEKILEDVTRATPGLRTCCLRYFNPAGAHPSGEIGEDPQGVPNNLLPFVSQFASGMHQELVIHGDDYPTHDGTCIRDYIHVCDLADGHLAALGRLEREPRFQVYNLGSGSGYSVLEVVNAFAKANDLDLQFRIGPRRPGDIPASYTTTELATRELQWQTQRSLEEICRDAWHWQQKNPRGYPD